MPQLQTVDLAAAPYLSGRFAPVHDEIDADDLVVEGTLPVELSGAYVRNGPNPRFAPLGSYTYPMEGDGMVHGVWLESGRARYRNRWVWTNGMKAEQRAGHALFGGLMTPNFIDMATLGPDPDPGWPYKLDAFINVVRHAGRLLALEEGTPPYEVTSALDTVGRHDFGGGLPAGMCAHPKIDPLTGEMLLFRYDVEAPFLTWAVVGADGHVTRPATPLDAVQDAFMVHDWAITQHHAVLVVAPVVLDTAAIGSGRDVIRWAGEDRPTRIAVISRADGGVTWIETAAFFAWHYGNAYEQGGRIIMDFPWSPRFSLRNDVRGGGFARATLDTERAAVDVQLVDDRGCEFPRIDDRRVGLPHRYVLTSRKSGRGPTAMGEFDQLVRHDMQTGRAVVQDVDAVFGEALFAPRPGGTDELDGWYLTFASSADANRSWLYVWDASAYPSPPVARVQMPRRVPNGLHGNWFPA